MRGAQLSKYKEILPWGNAALVILSGNWAAQSIYESVLYMTSGQGVTISYIRLFYIAIFLASAFSFYLQRHKLFPPRTRYFRNRDAEKRSHLILFLSSIRKDLEETGGIPQGLNLSGDIEVDIKEIEQFKIGKPNWPWEMPIRAIRHHLDAPLKTVTLVCSRESVCQADLFLSILARYEFFNRIKLYLLAKEDEDVRFWPLITPADACVCKGFNFESFDELTQAVWLLLEEFKKNKYPDRDIMVDITGGQKPTSVVGAAITFNRKIKAQYVQTNHPWEVLSYDVIHESSDTGRFGI
jgi:hypothetical protein